MGERNFGAMIMGWILSSIAQTIVMIFVLAISRYREYVADQDAAETIGRGEPLARALEKISNFSEQQQARAQAQGGRGRQRGRSQETGVNDSVQALCIFGGDDRSLLQKIFSTHPPTEERISRLRSY
jgi:heat shock protein HtpX